MQALKFKLESQQLTNTNSVKLMNALTQKGAKALFVGGCVRDAILNIPHSDIDIAINIPPEEVIKLLEKNHIAHKPLGIDHGSVLAIVNKEDFNITTLRTDVETFGRSAKVEFVDDWELDANRRDFTINALYADMDNNIYDPVHGFDDVIEKRVRFIGKAEERIQEDYLRILRYFRFYTNYAKLEPDHNTLKICQTYAHKLAGLSAERNWSELKKILSTPNPSHTLDLMHKYGILQALMPGQALHESDYWASLVTRDQSVAPSPIRRLAAVIKDEYNELQLLRLSTKESTTLRHLLRFKNHQPTDNQKFIYTYGVDLAIDLALLVDNKLLLQTAMQWQDIPFPVNGHDLQAIGLEPGELIGKALKEIESWWLSQNRIPSKQDCLAHFSKRNKL